MANKQEKTRKIVDKQKRLKEINNNIQICNAYLQMDPDPTAKRRVDALVENPCASGMFYLNAIYKESFFCSEEEAKEYAKQSATYQQHLLSYNKGSLEIYIKETKRLFTKDSLSYIGRNTGLGPYMELPSSSLATIYLNLDPLLESYGQELEEEINNIQTNGSDPIDQTEINDIIFDAHFADIYNEFMEDTVVVARSLDSNSRKLLENGVEQVYKCKKLLNWTAFKNFCDNQKKILKEQNMQTLR